jgi:putative transposase
MTSAPERAWPADIIEFATAKRYLAGVRDRYSRSLVGWSMSDRAKSDLVIDAAVLAASRR